MKVNRKLLQRVRDFIKAHPEIYNQNEFGSFSGNSCGTVCCIAGTAVLLTDPVAYLQYMRSNRPHKIYSLGCEFLGMPKSSNLLHHVNFWPEPFRNQYRKAASDNVRAAVAYSYINHFLKTVK